MGTAKMFRPEPGIKSDPVKRWNLFERVSSPPDGAWSLGVIKAVAERSAGIHRRAPSLTMDPGPPFGRPGRRAELVVAAAR